MNLSPGSRLGPYEIIAMIGAGGMGEVYRARDHRLGRDVAIKVLHASMAADADQIKRFEEEGKAAGALNHPNVVAVYDVGIENGSPYIVSELLEGETLRERLEGGKPPVRRAFEYALQIAHGLTAAHEKGIVHRDLKPENVFVNSDGRLKILDFGLARNAFGAAARAASGEATLTLPGAIMGTICYMSPEQVRGQGADNRSDVFAFGAIFYEMLAGQKAFDQATPAETMSMILREEPPELAGVERTLPPSAELIIRKCLEKIPDNRFQRARELAFALEAVAESSRSSATQQVSVTQTAPPGWRKSLPLAFAVGIALGAVVAAGIAFWFRAPAQMAEAPTLDYLTHSGHDTSPTMSASGSLVAFSSNRDGRKRIWTRDSDNGSESILTDGADANDDFPRIKPGTGTILFIRSAGSHSDLYTVSVTADKILRKMLSDVNEADWSLDGKRIACLHTRVDGGKVTSAVGVFNTDSKTERVLRSFPAELAHPRWSPDGKAIALVPSAASTGKDSQRLVLLDPNSGEVSYRSLASPYGVSAILWTGPNEILYSQAETVAIGDAEGSEGGGAIVYRQDVSNGDAKPRVFFRSPHGCQFLDTGRIAPGGAPGPRSSWIVFDTREVRQNLREVALAAPDQGRWLAHGTSTDRQPVYAPLPPGAPPDSGRVLFSSNRAGDPDLWTIGLKNGEVSDITQDRSRAIDWDPAYTDNGDRILFSSNRSGNFEIWSVNSTGQEPKQLSHDGVNAQNPTATPDGNWIVYASRNRDKAGLWKIARDGSGATQIVKGEALLPQVSPDGQWVAYTTRVPGTTTIRVVRVADGAAAPFEIAISIRNPKLRAGRSRWMPGGKQLAFVGQNEGMSGIYVQDFVPGKDTSSTRLPLGKFDPDVAPESFAVSPDGTHLIMANVEQVFSLMVVKSH